MENFKHSQTVALWAPAMPGWAPAVTVTLVSGVAPSSPLLRSGTSIVLFFSFSGYIYTH